MKFKGSIRKKLTAIILLITTLTSLIGYGSFVYWYMQNQQKQSFNLAQTIGKVLAQDVAKLVLLNEVSAAADISSNLKSFSTLNNMVLYNLEKKPIYQFSKDNKNFNIQPLPNNFKKSYKIIDNNLQLYIKALYQNNHLGYVQLNFKVKSIWDVIKQNIKMLIFILLFMFIISYLLAIYFAKEFTKPILKLVSFLEKIEFLDSKNQKIYTSEDNEYGKLYQEINTMLNRLQSNQEALKIAAVAFETQNGMTITDANHNILNVNKAFSEITGYSKEEAIGNNPSILKSGIHDKEFYTNMYDNLHKNHYWSGEIKNKRKDGEILHEYLTIQVVLDENKQIKYYIASFSDITLYKQMQKDLQQKEKILNQQSKMATMGEMLENIAHQWRQPLSIISTLATSMQIQKELYINIPRDEELDKLKKINTTTQHLSQTIEDFRDFFQPNKKKIKFNLKDAYYKTLNLINSKFKTLDIEMVENIEDIYIESYHNELIQVIMNILNNARDILVTKKDKRIIFISIYKENNNAVISIKDNAGGVPDNIIDKIFEPYFTTKHKSQGTGIGLYMSQNIITKHINGTLNVYNEEFNYNGISYKGANFIITIAL